VPKRSEVPKEGKGTKKNKGIEIIEKPCGGKPRKKVRNLGKKGSRGGGLTDLQSVLFDPSEGGVNQGANFHQGVQR